MMPDYWKAYGNVATAVPIMVFQHEKIMIIELCFSPSYGADMNGSLNKKSSWSITCEGGSNSGYSIPKWPYPVLSAE